VRESVESVMAQDIEDFELIVCDDHSTDATWSILQQYGGDGRCRLLRNQTNLGLFPTLNRLVREARSDWVHLWSQDDRMLPHCLRRTREFANAHAQVGMIYSGRYQIDENGRRLPEGPEDSTPELISPLLAARIMFYFGSIAGNIANVTLRRDAFNQIGGFAGHLEVSGDYDYWTRVSERLPIGFQREPLIELRSHRNQFSRQLHSGTQFIRENRAIHDRLFERLPAPERKSALHYRRWVLQVKHFHHAVRCALDGELTVSREILDLLRAETAVLPLAGRWLLSANGRLVTAPNLQAE
jgi:glycosyltransferase involved in cell wall biosynthesis